MANGQNIKQRIKSIQSTMQITRAMELVASSKLRKAKEQAEKVRPFFTTLYETMSDIAKENRDFSSPYTKVRAGNRCCYIVIAGDRGLAGGYNANTFRLAEQAFQGKQPKVIAIGKKAVEYFEKRSYPVLRSFPGAGEDMKIGQAWEMAQIVCRGYLKGEYDQVKMVYTNFVSTLSLCPAVLDILPLAMEAPKSGKAIEEVLYEPSAQEVFDTIVPPYVAGILYGAVCESFACEQAARRTAMESANDNAGEMIEKLQLQYNQARQAAITQEITEIVAGAGIGN